MPGIQLVDGPIWSANALEDLRGGGGGVVAVVAVVLLNLCCFWPSLEYLCNVLK